MIDSYQYNDHSGIGAFLDSLSGKVAHALRVGGGLGCTNIDRGPMSYATAEQKAKAVELARTGQHTCTEICRMTGVRHSSVRRILIRLGIAVPKGNRWQKKISHV
jgi:transposase